MLQSYHLMKISRSLKTETSSDEANVFVPKKASKSKSPRIRKRHILPKCRVCLKEAGENSIHGDNPFNVVEALLLCCDIEVQVNDIYPKHLCTLCFEFLRKAFEFRTLAKKSEIILKSSIVIKEECIEETKPKTSRKISEDKNKDIELNYDILEPESIYDKRRVRCKLCGSIVSALYIRTHLSRMHENVNERTHICDVCGKTFRQLGNLTSHKKQHSDIFPFLCSSCPFRARYKNLLDVHMRRHTGEKKFMCSNCPARFYTSGNLSKHMRSHRDPAFKCDICGRPYRSKENMKSHIEGEHLGIRQKFSCNLCGNIYSKKRELYKHQIKKHGRQKSAYSRLPSYLQVDKNML